MLRFLSSPELVARCQEEGVEVDIFTPKETLLNILSGVDVEPKSSEVTTKAKELGAFVAANKYRLNLVCGMVCTQCSAGLILWCWRQMPRAKEMLDGTETD